MNLRWAEFIRECRATHGWNKREMADALRIDASYLTLMEAGRVPSKKLVLRMADALARDRDEVLLLAGFAPISLGPDEVYKLVKRRRCCCVCKCGDGVDLPEVSAT